MAANSLAGRIHRAIQIFLRVLPLKGFLSSGVFHHFFVFPIVLCLKIFDNYYKNIMNNIHNFIEFIDDVDNVGRRKPQEYKKRPNYFETLSDDEFIYRFRLSKNCASYLLNLLKRQLETPTDR